MENDNLKTNESVEVTTNETTTETVEVASDEIVILNKISDFQLFQCILLVTLLFSLAFYVCLNQIFSHIRR